jgi:transposase
MARFIPVPVRQVVVRRSRQGQDALTIACALGLSVRTVRRLLQRFRSEGPQAVAPSYSHCGRPALQAPPPLIQEALHLREQHRPDSCSVASASSPSLSS